MQIAPLILPLYSLSSFEVLTQNDCYKRFINEALLNILRTKTVRKASYSPKNQKCIKSRNTRQSHCEMRRQKTTYSQHQHYYLTLYPQARLPTPTTSELRTYSKERKYKNKSFVQKNVLLYTSHSRHKTK